MIVSVLCFILVILTLNCVIANDDSDNDGIANEYDGINGIASDVVIYSASTDTAITDFSIEVDGSSNISQYFVSTHTIVFYVDSRPIVEFVYNFATAPVYGTATPPVYGAYAISNQTILDFTAINITLNPNSGAGGIIVNGINLSSQNFTKTVYIDKTLGTNTVCIIDAEVSSISVSEDCTNGDKVVCDDSSSNALYSCTSENNKYKITGLKHSAVTEYSYDPSGHGGRGGSRGSPVCYPDWECSDWGECVNTFKRRTCTDNNNCGNPTNVPETTEKCSTTKSSPSKSTAGTTTTTKNPTTEEYIDPNRPPEYWEDGIPREEEDQEEEEKKTNTITGAVIGALGKSYIILPIIIIIIILVSLKASEYYYKSSKRKK